VAPDAGADQSVKKREEIMKKVIIAIIALGALTFRAEAQMPKPAASSEQIYWVLTGKVDQMDKYKPLIQKLVAATEKEPGTLEYEYAVGDDQKTVDIFERYADSKAAASHVTETFGPNFSKEFLALFKPTRFVVYGTPSADLKKVLADFHPIYMTPWDGFTK
jgi:quinol monooxygenase YgiN